MSQNENLDTKKEAFGEVLKTLRGQMLVNLNIKDSEEVLKETYARIHQLKDKKGNLKISEVKMGPMKSAIALFNQEPGYKDTILEAYELREQYLTHMRNERSMKNGDNFPLDELIKYQNVVATKKELTTMDEVKSRLSSIEDITDAEISGMEIIANTIVMREEIKEKEKREKEKSELEGKNKKLKKPKEKKSKDEMKDAEKEKEIQSAIDNLLKVLGLNPRDFNIS